MKIKEIIDYLEKIAPLYYQEDYDNSGLLIGDSKSLIKSALITLDCSEKVIDEAIQSKCNLIITHHPIIFKGLKKINGKNHTERSIIKAIKHNICIYSMHTNLDNIYNGVNARIAERIGLHNVNILFPKIDSLRQLVVYAPKEYADKVRNSLFESGAGNISNYDQCSFNTNGIGTFRPLAGSNPFLGKSGIQRSEHEERIEVIFPKHLQSSILENMKKIHPYEEIAHQIYVLENLNQKVGAGIIGDLSKSISDKYIHYRAPGQAWYCRNT